MRNLRDLFGCLSFLLLAGCDDLGPGPNDPHDFYVTVRSSPGGDVVQGVRIRGGLDWTYFDAVSDASGRAFLPARLWGVQATFSSTNYLPFQAKLYPDRIYEMVALERRMTRIGTAPGTVVSFQNGLLLTLEYNGRYHAYGYDSSGVAERMALDLEPLVKDVAVFGNMFWMSTFEAGVRAYSVEDPLSPSLIWSVPMEGYLASLAVQDTLLAVASNGPGPIRVYRYDLSQSPVLRATIRNYSVRDLGFIDHYLVVIGGSEALPVVFDLSNPAAPRLVYNGVEPDYGSAFLYRRRLVLVPRSWKSENTLLELFQPTEPKIRMSFYADSRLEALVDDFTAVGSYPLGGISIMRGSIASYFSTAGIVDSARTYQGSDPPYYKFDDTIWRLEP